MRLLESSKVKKKKGFGGTTFSVGFHAAIILLVVYATSQAADSEPETMSPQRINFVKPVTAAPEPPKQRPTRLPSDAKLAKVAIPAPALGFKTLNVPIEIPTKIPDIDPTAQMTNEADFTGKGVAGGIGKGLKGSAGGANSTGTTAGSDIYTENDVDEVVVSLGNVQPVYPEAMRAAGVEGQVLVQFIVNEKGRVESGSIKIINSANPMFEASVRSALPRMKFKPATVNGRPVKQLVQQPFQFKLNS